MFEYRTCRWINLSLGLSLLALMAMDVTAPGAEPSDTRQSKASEAVAVPRMRDIVYRSPWPDAPRRRIDGPARGSRDHELSLRALAPETVGLTTLARPTLYWFNSAAIPYPVMIFLAEESRPEPLLQVRFADGLADGVHAVDLAEHGVELSLGVEYRWTVEVVIDPANPSRDLVASGTILRVAAPGPVVTALAAASPADRAAIYAENGVWYDALDTLGQRIRNEPENPVWRLLRASLLNQVALPEAAAYDRNKR